DPVLAQLLVELRAAVAQIEAARTAGRTPDGLISRQSGLERAIRDHVRALPGATVTARRPTADEIGSALGDAVLVEYVEHRDALFAVTIAGSRVRLTPLRPTAGVRGSFGGAVVPGRHRRCPARTRRRGGRTGAARGAGGGGRGGRAVPRCAAAHRSGRDGRRGEGGARRLQRGTRGGARPVPFG